MKKNIFRACLISLSILTGNLLLMSCSTEATEKKAEAVNVNEQNSEVERLIQNWPETPRSVARAMVEKYGQPSEMSSGRLVWNNCAPWKRTTVYKEEVLHRFPEPHASVLEQTIDYQVSLDKYNAITSFNGSVLMDRTKGELSARTDTEAMNFLAINLAQEIDKGVISIPHARNLMYQEKLAYMGEQVTEYTRGFNFELPEGEQSDPDFSMTVPQN